MLSKILRMLRSSSEKPEVAVRNAGSISVPTDGSSRPIVLVSPACPYCGVIQEPPPQRRRKCKDCDQIIHTRTDRLERKRYLLTEKQAEQAERERRDARWKELSQQVQDAMRCSDWQSLRHAYYEQASILFAEGRPHRHVMQEAMKASLMEFRRAGIASVRVRTARDERVCDECSALDGTVFTVTEAMKRMPIPGPACRDGEERNPHGGRCRCIYGGVF